MTLTLHDRCHVENTLEPILSSDEVMVRRSSDVLIPNVTGGEGWEVSRVLIVTGKAGLED